MSQYERRRKWLAGISITVVVLLVILVTLFVSRWLRSFTQDDFRDYVQSFGFLGPLYGFARVLQAKIDKDGGVAEEAAAETTEA